MRRLHALAAALALTVSSVTAQAAEPAPVRVLVLGVAHFGNPGQDLNNVRMDDVLAPRRQAEIADVTRRLARFRPTVVAVEAESDRPDLSSPAYATFTPADLAVQRNETVQLGFRLAREQALPVVYAVDEQPGEGEPDYFPFDRVLAFAESHGQTEQLDQPRAAGAAFVQTMEARQASGAIVDVLRAANDPAAELAMHRAGYYGVLRVGDGHQQPGAELNALWYMRNAKILSKLAHVAKPGDRVVLVFGAGHGYWLRHLIANTPGFELADTLACLSDDSAGC